MRAWQTMQSGSGLAEEISLRSPVRPTLPYVLAGIAVVGLQRIDGEEVGPVFMRVEMREVEDDLVDRRRRACDRHGSRTEKEAPTSAWIRNNFMPTRAPAT